MLVHRTEPHFEDTPIFLMSRFLADDGELAQQADVVTITASAYDSGGTQIGMDVSVSVATSVFDALVDDDPRWGRRDSIGYNFGHLAPGSFFPAGGAVNTVEYEIVLVSGNLIVVAFDVPVIERRSG